MISATTGQIAALHRLARLFEVDVSFVAEGDVHYAASPETLLQVLRHLGAELNDLTEIEAAHRARLLQIWNRQLDPVVVIWGGKPGAHALLRLPEGELQPEYSCRVVKEDGSDVRWHQDRPEAMKRGPLLDGVQYHELRLPLPDGLPYGYHRLEVEVAAQTLTASIIAAPVKAFSRPRKTRDWGLFLPLYALHSQHSEGIGDYRDLGQLTGWAAEQGAAFVGTLPLLASSLDEPYDPSPYSPVSRLFWHEVYVHTGNLPRLENQGAFVDYRAVMTAKRRVLEASAETLAKAGGSAEMTSFLEARPEVRDYARFRAAQEHLGPDWRRWPAAAARGELKPGDWGEQTEQYFLYAQWQAHLQMEAVVQGTAGRLQMYLDLPVGVHPAGYDTWRYQDVFAAGLSVGAPPDLVTSTGQNWGFSPLDPFRLRQSGYQYLSRYLRHNLSLGGILRIDHVFGLQRLYCLPEGAASHEGVYINFRVDETFAVLCLESYRAGTEIIGEDIGSMPYGFRRRMKRHGLGRLLVLTGSIAVTDEAPVPEIPPEAMASFGTHDMAPFAAYWDERDLTERTELGVFHRELLPGSQAKRRRERAALEQYLRAQGLLTGKSSVLAVMQAMQVMLARSPAAHVILNLEDLWLETASQNVPGTGFDRHPNWQRRARLSLEELMQDERVLETMQMVAAARRA